MRYPAAVVGILFFIAACAAPQEQPAVVDEIPQPVAGPAEETVADTADVGAVDAPGVPDASIAPDPRPGGGRVCRLEKRTGTNRAVRVCRSVAEIQGEAIEAKETFERLRRSQQQVPRQ